MELKKGDKIYYARILENVGVYDVYDLIVRTAEDDWFVGIDAFGNQAFIFDNSDIGKRVFLDRLDAVMTAQEAEEKGGKNNKKMETYYEEF